MDADGSHYKPVLILWDIDHTLVDIGEVSQEIYARAFQQVTGQPLRELVAMTGRTEQAILIDTLARNGVEPAATLDAFYAALGAAARSLAGRMRQAGRRLPGAKEAIDALAGTGTVQSVVTGNIRPIAATKLAAFDLSQRLDLDVGGYGDDGSDRAVLVRLARQRAERKHDRAFVPHRVVVIGDTPYDVKGAHDNGALAVGVATGHSTAAELRAAGADIVLGDLTDPSALRSAVLARLRASG